VVIRVFEGNRVQEGVGVAEGFEHLFVGCFGAGDELVDVEGEEDEGDEDHGGEADCLGVGVSDVRVVVGLFGRTEIARYLADGPI